MDPDADHMRLVLTGLPAVAGWFLLSGALVYGVMALDRRRVQRRGGRVPEASLLWLAGLGGWMGAMLALWRHPGTPFSAQFRGWLRGIVAVELICLGLAGMPPQAMVSLVEGAMTLAMGDVRAERKAKPGKLMLDSSRRAASIGNIVTLSAGP